MTILKETSEECDLHNISHEDVIMLIATMHCNKKELKKDIKRYRNPTWLAVKQLAENYKPIVDELHKVGQVKQQQNKINYRGNAFALEARDTNPTNANWTGQANAYH